MVKQQIVFGVANEFGDVPYERGIRNDDAGDGLKSVGSHVNSSGNQTTVNSTRAQALLAYPRGFHSDAGNSGCVTPVSSQARAVTLRGPGSTCTVSDQGRHAQRLGAGCRMACCQVRPPSTDTSTRSTVWPSPAIA